MAKDTVIDPGVAARKAAKETRERAEAVRIVRAKMVGAAPVECGPDVITVCPARGPIVSMRMRRLVPDSTTDTGVRSEDAGHLGRRTIRAADVFDLMAAQSKRAGGNSTAIPFDLVTVGREYRDLTEKLQSAGMKCSSTFDTGSTGGTGGDFMDAYTHDAGRLRWCHTQIGFDTALVIKRRRPSKRGGKTQARQNIEDRMLVDMVCIGDKSLSAVLSAYGWSVNAANLEVLRTALCRVLERLRGI